MFSSRDQLINLTFKQTILQKRRQFPSPLPPFDVPDNDFRLKEKQKGIPANANVSFASPKTCHEPKIFFVFLGQ